MELKDWPKEKADVYWLKAEGYSEANGGMYLSWVKAVRNWDRDNPWTPVEDEEFKGMSPEFVKSIKEGRENGH